MIAHTVARAFLWTLATTIATAAIFEAFVLAMALVATPPGKSSLPEWVSYGFSATLQQLIVILGIQLPFNFLMGSIWIASVRRQPHLDQTRRGLLIGCLIVSAPATAAFWSFASWMYKVAPIESTASAITVSALITMVFNYLGVLIPRLIVPGLKQGQLVPHPIESAPEHVR